MEEPRENILGTEEGKKSTRSGEGEGGRGEKGKDNAE